MLRGFCAVAVAATIGLLAAPASATVYSSMGTLDLNAHYRAQGTTFGETMPLPDAVGSLDADGRTYELLASLHLSDFSLDLPPSDQPMTWTLTGSLSGRFDATSVDGQSASLEIPLIGGEITTFEATLDEIFDEVSGLIGLLAGSVPPPGYAEGLGGYALINDYDGNPGTFDPGLAGGLIEGDDLFVFLNEFMGLGIENPLPLFSSADLYLSIELWAHADDGIAAIPEPAAIGLLGLGLAGIAFARRRKA